MLRHNVRGNRADWYFYKASRVFAFFIILIVFAMLTAMIMAAWPAISRFGLNFLWNTAWNPVTEEYGALPFIYGSIVSSLLALLIAVPLSLGAAIFLTELAPRWLMVPVSFMIELLAAIPSVIYGLWGLFVLVPFLRLQVQPWLGSHLGFLPFFQGPAYGVGMLAAGIILAIMILPTITSISRDVLGLVPNDQREAMLALGATRWETIWHAVLPYGKSGLIGGVILGLGRAIGETMAVTMVIGNRHDISLSLFAPSNTMASIIANEFAEAVSEIYTGVLMELGLILFLVTLLINVFARLLTRRISAKGSKNGGAGNV
ncbi:MAG: phosphate ABC transporter permease subunit PstC [Carboxydocellales bacterium]